jgi:hypothetical protein
MSGVPYIFANATTSIPLSELDSNFATPVYIGNASVALGNTVTSIGNVTLTNVTISSGNVTATSVVAPTIGSASGSTLSLQSNGTTNVTLDTSGNLLVGTTNTDPVNNRVNGLAIAGTSGIDIRSATNVTLWGLNATSGNHIRFFTDNGSAAVAAGIISSSGSVTSYAVTSDYRLKQNVAPLQNGLKTISELKPCSYNYIEGNQYSEGFIAHELQAVVPHAVTGEKDAVDANGKPEYQAVDSSFLVPHLVAAIQELSAQVKTLQSQVTALQAKVGT